jgi:antitoxin PrlF
LSRWRGLRQVFWGAITTRGRSGALRLEKSFFEAHPEFRLKAKLRVHHIGLGQLLVSVEDGPKVATAEDAHDPIVSADLAFLEKDMAANPGSLSRFSSAELDKLTDLLKGVSVSDEDVLPDDVTS